MMLHTPKNTKYRKCQKRPMRIGYCHKACELRVGNIGLQATSCGILKERQIEAARRAINRQIKQFGKTHIRVLADKPVTKKATATKLGRGKGNIEYWCLPVQTGRIIYEITGDKGYINLCRLALKKGGAKLPFTTKIIERSL